MKKCINLPICPSADSILKWTQIILHTHLQYISKENCEEKGMMRIVIDVKRRGVIKLCISIPLVYTGD